MRDDGSDFPWVGHRPLLGQQCAVMGQPPGWGAGQRLLSCQAQRAVDDHLIAATGDAAMSLTTYNDEVATCVDDVAIIMEKAAANL